MPLQGPEAAVEMRELIDSVPDLGALAGDDVAQLAGDPFAMARGTQDGELARPFERQVE